MSLVSLPKLEKIPQITENPLYIQNGIMIQPVLECLNLRDISFTGNKPTGMRSNFAVIATFLINLEDIRLVHDQETDKNMWWGFMRGCGKVYVSKHAKHDKPTYFI